MTDQNAGKKVGNYEIIGKLGQGGMGAVFKARQLNMDRLVALKVLPPQYARDPKYVQRFLREAQSAGAINHPRLVNAIECGKAGDYYFFSMELVDGPNLKQVQRQRGAALPETDVIDWLEDIAEALQAAHGKGFVHRDVKPENILIDKQGRAKLADLGLAKPISGDADVTMGGVAIGTPHYLSPEQAKGEHTDGRSDIYSLGATAFDLLTGEKLFSGPTATAVNVKHVSEEPRRAQRVNTSLSKGIDALIDRCLQKDPRKRYQDCTSLLEDLQRIREGKSLKNIPVNKKRSTARSQPANKPKPAGSAWTVPVGVGGLVVAAALAAWVLFGDQQPTTSPINNPKAQPAAVATANIAESQITAPAKISQPITNEKSTANAEEMLAFAQEYIAKHPGDFAKGRHMLERAREAGKGTLVEFKVDEALEQLRQKEKQHALTLWKQHHTTVEKLADQQQYDQAIAQIRAFITKHPQLIEYTTNEAEKATQTVAQRAVQAIETGLEQASQAIGQQEFDNATTILQQLGNIQYQAGLKNVQHKISGLRQQAKRGLAAAAEQANSAWAEIQNEFITGLLQANNSQAVREKASNLAQAEKHAPIRKQLSAIVDVTKAIEARDTFLHEWLDDKIGTDMSILTIDETRTGKILSVDDKWLKLEMTKTIGDKTHTFAAPIAWKNIRPEQLRDWYSHWQARSEHDHMAAALASLATGDAVAAAQALAKASNHPLARAAGDRLKELQLGAAEAAAHRDWDTINGANPHALSEKAAEQFLNELDDFATKHSTTKLYADNKQAWQQLRDAAFARTAEGSLKSGLTIYWDMEGDDPYRWVDRSGNSNDWVIKSKHYSLRHYRGAGGKGIQYFKEGKRQAGHGHGIQYENGNIAAGWQQMSISLWLEPTEDLRAAGNEMIGGATTWRPNQPGNRIWLLNWGRDLTLRAYLDDRKAPVVLGTGLATHSWHHVALVFDGSADPSQRWQCYLNGQLIGAASSAWTTIPRINDPNMRLWLRTWFKTNRWGALKAQTEQWVYPTGFAEIRLYKRALTAKDIMALKIEAESRRVEKLKSKTAAVYDKGTQKPAAPATGIKPAPTAAEMHKQQWSWQNKPVRLKANGTGTHGNKPITWKIGRSGLLRFNYGPKPAPKRAFRWNGTHWMSGKTALTPVP